jgi:putative RNA 2'-phosphotransferase
MDADHNIKASKFLSLILRHKPETIGLVLDEAGWTPVADLLAGCARKGIHLSLPELKELVSASDKQRFTLSEDGLFIRANQGHSVAVELGLKPAVPPEVLYHGTIEKFLPSIRMAGLRKGQRHHVHLSSDEATALRVGQRRGLPVILKIQARSMHAEGFVFFLSANDVWLTDHVPSQYIV